MRPLRRRRARAGLTLIEVTITLGLVVLIIMPVFALLLTSRRSAGESRLYVVARAAAESRIEQLRAQGNVGDAEFAGLAQGILAAPTFAVPGLPPTASGAPHGRVIVCLDETRQFFTAADGAHYGSAPWNAVPYPAFGVDLDASGGANVVPAAGAYRVLPVRVEISWGREATPKVWLDAVVAPRSGFVRG